MNEKLSEKISRFESEVWHSSPVKRLEATLCQLELIKKELDADDVRVCAIEKLESRLMFYLPLPQFRYDSALCSFLPFRKARDIIIQFL